MVDAEVCCSPLVASFQNSQVAILTNHWMNPLAAGLLLRTQACFVYLMYGLIFCLTDQPVTITPQNELLSIYLFDHLVTGKKIMHLIIFFSPSTSLRALWDDSIIFRVKEDIYFCNFFCKSRLASCNSLICKYLSMALFQGKGMWRAFNDWFIDQITEIAFVSFSLFSSLKHLSPKTVFSYSFHIQQDSLNGFCCIRDNEVAPVSSSPV